MMKRLLAVVLATVTLLTGSLGVSASEVTSQPESNTTTETTEQTPVPKFKKLKWGNNKISGVGEKAFDSFTGKKIARYEVLYKFSVSSVSDVTMKAKFNKNINGVARFLVYPLNDYLADNGGLIEPENLEYSYDIKNGKRVNGEKAYATYKSLSTGDYVVVAELCGKKSQIGKKLGCTLTLTKKKSSVGQVTNFKVKKLSSNKYKISWKKEGKVTKYEYRIEDGKVKTLSGKKTSIIIKASKKDKKRGSLWFNIRALNGKKTGSWKECLVFNNNI